MEARGLTEAGLVSNFSNIQVSLEVCEREGSSSEGNEDDLTGRWCNKMSSIPAAPDFLTV